MVADDVDAYSGALPGLQLEVIRTGVGVGPNLTRSWSGNGLAVASGRVQFPVLGRTSIADNRVVVVVVISAPPGTRWCEVDLEPGAVLVYGPGADHTAISPVGVEYSLVLVDLDVLGAVAEDLRWPFPRIDRGRVHALPPMPGPQSLAPLRDSFGDRGADIVVTRAMQDASMHAVLAAASTPPPARARDSRRIDSRRIVNACVDELEMERGIPSIAMMCRAASVSERRLREAFISTFDVPPKRYWQSRLLSEARERLISGEAGSDSVQAVALDLGFNHMGRFSRQYQQQFGEQPSQTLSPRPHRPRSADMPNVDSRGRPARVA